MKAKDDDSDSSDIDFECQNCSAWVRSVAYDLLLYQPKNAYLLSSVSSNKITNCNMSIFNIACLLMLNLFYYIL